MTTTSTEYAITKRGMSPHLRKRDKPLRTYGKRPQNNGDEPPAKKRRCSSVDGGARDEKLKARDRHVTTTTNTGKGGDAEPEQPGRRGSKEAEEPRGSILSYFKRVETETVKSEKSKGSEEEAEREESPRPARRKPRLLRLRATSNTDTELSNPPPRKKRRSPLEECSAGNHQDQAVDTKKKKKKATAAITSVQTVLNISPQAAFSECKVCDTVWNPLWPDDVKYHLKRHAAAAGRRKREEGLLLLL